VFRADDLSGERFSRRHAHDDHIGPHVRTSARGPAGAGGARRPGFGVPRASGCRRTRIRLVGGVAQRLARRGRSVPDSTRRQATRVRPLDEARYGTAGSGPKDAKRSCGRRVFSPARGLEADNVNRREGTEVGVLGGNGCAVTELGAGRGGSGVDRKHRVGRQYACECRQAGRANGRVTRPQDSELKLGGSDH
jgi:hypothetical protein